MLPGSLKDHPNPGAQHKLRSCCFTLQMPAVRPSIIVHEHVHELGKWFFVIAHEHGGVFAIGCNEPVH